MHEEYDDIPLTDGHIGFQEQRVYPVRAADMPDAHLLDLPSASNKAATTTPYATQQEAKYPGHEPYMPLTEEERAVGRSGLLAARAISAQVRKARGEG